MATESLHYLMGIEPSLFSRKELFIVEAELFLRLYTELKNFFKTQNRTIFELMKLDSKMEDIMIEDNFARCVINDILSTEQYTLSGIAYYTQTPEDVVFDVAYGKNTSPSAKFITRIITLHRSVRSDLYDSIQKRIANSLD